MKTMILTVGVCAAVTLTVGCRNTQVAGVRRSQEEAAWEQTIRRNYPNYRAPRAAAPADSGNTETRISAPVDTGVKPENDPAAVTEPAELEPAPAPETEAKPEVKPEVKPEAKPEAKPEVKPEVKPEAKPEVKPEAKPEAKPVAPPDPTNSTVYEVRSGDTLGKIAQKHYGSARYGNMIYKANTDMLKNPNLLRPGMKLIIPKL